MKIVPIFAPKLFAFHYKGELKNELGRLLDSWNNPVELSKFLLENKNDIGAISIDDLIDKIINDVEDIENTLKKFTNETKVSYPLLAADMAGSDLAFSLGNDQDVLPYTVIIKPDGTVAKTFFGRLSMPKLEETLKQKLLVKVALHMSCIMWVYSFLSIFSLFAAL